MKHLVIAAALSLSTGLHVGRGMAQPAAAAQDGFPPSICRDLLAFMTYNGRVHQDDTPVRLEEAQRYAREDNRYACKSAIHGLYTAGVPLPASLLAAIGIQPSPAAGVR